MQQFRAFLVMLDISGYTRFMSFHATSLLHAEEIITELLEAVLNTADYPLTIAKLEGDAVFMYANAPDGKELLAAQDIMKQLDEMFRSFYVRERAMLGCKHGCVCEACRNIGELKLKAILHVGDVTVRQIRQLTELGGQDVTLVHRLLKNSIPSREYVLMTEPFHALAGDYQAQSAERRTEQVDELGEVEVLVYYPKFEIEAQDMPQVKGTELAARLNQHSFARMFRRKPRGEFNHLPVPKMNLILYLIEGIASGLNVLRLQLVRSKVQQSKKGSASRSL